MPASGFYNTAGTDALAFFTPQDDWDRRERRREYEMQLANVAESRARQDANEQQQAVNAQLNNIAQLKALPVESPDRPKTEAYINSLINNTLANVKKNYNGDFQKWLLNEGDSALMQLRDSYLSSGVYAKATQNKYEMDQARKAIASGQSMIGSMDANGNYTTAEENIMKFQNGETDGFRFRGAYDASKAKPYEYYGKTYNPGGSKFERASAAESDKLAFAQSTLGAEAGYDYYNKAMKGKNFFYKTDPIEDRTMFNLDVANKQSAIDLLESQTAENFADAQKALQDAKDKADPIKNQTYFQTQLSQSMGTETASNYAPNSPYSQQSIPDLGVKVSDLSTTPVGGKPNITMSKFPNLRGADRANQMLGIARGERKGKPVLTGTLKDILLLDKGGAHYDLRGIPQVLQDTDDYVYVDGKETRQSTVEGRYPSRAFKKFSLLVRKDEFDKKYGSTEKPGPVEERTLASGGSKEYYKISGFAPLPKWYQNKEVEQELTKQVVGQAQANQIFIPKSDAIAEFE